jgi:hypothetical protein
MQNFPMFNDPIYKFSSKNVPSYKTFPAISKENIYHSSNMYTFPADSSASTIIIIIPANFKKSTKE